MDGDVRGEAAIEHGMGVRRHRFPAATWVRAGVASGVRELKADEEIVGLAETLGMRADERFAETGELLFGVWADTELIGVGAAVVTHRDGFASPDQFRAAPAEVRPSASREIGRAAVECSVPAFHGQDAEAVADGDAVAFERLGERRGWAGLDRAIEREGHIQFTEALQERVGGFQGCDARIRHRLSAHSYVTC